MAVREIKAGQITGAIERLASEVPYHLGGKELDAIRLARSREESPTGRQVLDDLIENAGIAARGEFPLCQDTGLAVVFIDWGQDCHLVGGSLQEAVDEGVRLARKKAYLRASVVRDPFERSNTGDNTPAVVHVTIVEGDKVKIIYDAKGGGSENMARLAMLKPADGIDGVVEFAVKAVREASGNPCPPVIVGIGVGGNFEKSALMAKRAILRPLGDRHPDESLAGLEARILEEVNRTGVGPGGLGGKVTALAVHVEVAPCHMASLPVAVNLDCHAHRHGEALI